MQQDPTRTLTLRAAYERNLVARLKKLAAVIKQSIIDNDCFDLNNKFNTSKPGGVFINAPSQKFPVEVPPMTPAGKFLFATTEEKIEAFLEWLYEMIDKGILEVTARDGRRVISRKAWQNLYIRSTYQQALEQGLTELVRAGIDTGIDFGAGIGDATQRSQAAIGQLFYRPFHADRVGILFTRQFNLLKNITDAMSGQIGRVLAEGMARGEGPRKIAKAIVEQVEGVGIRRARLLARTEIINDHAEATLNLYEDYGIEGVAIKAEWSTAGDGRVCDKCKSRNNKVYSLKEARGLIPLHPQCRCAWLPVVLEQKEREKKNAFGRAARTLPMMIGLERKNTRYYERAA